MSIKQLSVFAENKEGTLADVTDAIAQAGVDIRAMSLADTQDFGIVRLIVDDIESAKQKLNENNCFVSVTEVVGVAVNDEPGGLARVIRLFADNGINIDYMYAFISVSKKNAYVVLRVDDCKAAEDLLVKNGVTLINEDDVAKL